jgi:hypothetical protein
MHRLWASPGIDYPRATTSTSRRVAVVLENANRPNGSANHGYSQERVNALDVIAHAERLALVLRRQSAVARRLRIASNRYSPAIDSVHASVHAREFPTLLLQPIISQSILGRVVFLRNLP